MKDNIVVINGKELADSLIQTQKLNLPEGVRNPFLAVITVGDNEASKIYVNNKKKACEKCGIEVLHLKYPEDVSRDKLVKIINELNYSDGVDGIIVQQPLPYDLKGVEEYVKWNKDVDGFTATNLGKSFGTSDLQLNACTPSGILTMLQQNNIELQGKHAVIIGRSNIVGKPLIGMLLAKNCTVTSCNSYTKDLKEITKAADILIVAIGKPKMIDASYISPKCTVVIDVGINRVDGKICGDCDFDNIVACWNLLDDNITRYITPVPKGVGPMTVYSLIQNTNLAYTSHLMENINKKRKYVGV